MKGFRRNFNSIVSGQIFPLNVNPDYNQLYFATSSIKFSYMQVKKNFAYCCSLFLCILLESAKAGFLSASCPETAEHANNMYRNLVVQVAGQTVGGAR